jgi:Spy/CpxP family protein refolding chaperone
MMRRTLAAISAVAVLPTIHVSAMAASAKSVNRPLADQLTRQFNQQELEQLQPGGGTYPQSGAGQLNRQQLGGPGTPLPPPGISRSVMPPPE